MTQVNLNTLASEVARAEGLGQSIGVAQIKEVLGILGHRWRSMSVEEYQRELNCIVQRAGMQSAHREEDTNE